MAAHGHSLAAWYAKVLAGAALLALVCERYLVGGLPAAGDPPAWPGQTLVLLGGLSNIAHYIGLKRRTRSVAPPAVLVTDVGLYRWIRHPMYSGDIVLFAGLALMAPSGLSALLCAIGIPAAWRQAVVEDGYLAQRFHGEHEAWRQRAGLLLPRWPNRAC